MEESIEKSTPDCIAKEPTNLKKINGIAIEEIYNTCLDAALGLRASVFPVKAKKALIPLAFDDCRNLEIRYLGLAPAAPDKAAFEKAITLNRSRKLKELNAAITSFEARVGKRIALLEVTQKLCRNVNKQLLANHYKQTLQQFKRPSSIPEDEVDFFEHITAWIDSYLSDVRAEGRKTWCATSQNELEKAALKGVFTK